MNKEELVQEVANQTKLNKKQAKDAVTSICSAIASAVANGKTVTLVGFGTFKARDRKERTGRNPYTGATMNIPATTVPTFSAGKMFKEKVAKSARK